MVGLPLMSWVHILSKGYCPWTAEGHERTCKRIRRSHEKDHVRPVPWGWTEYSVQYNTVRSLLDEKTRRVQSSTKFSVSCQYVRVSTSNFCTPIQSCTINERQMVTGRTSERIPKFGSAHACFFRRTTVPVKVDHFSQVISNLLTELPLCDLSEETPCDAHVFGNLNHHALPTRFCTMARAFCNQIFARGKYHESRPRFSRWLQELPAWNRAFLLNTACGTQRHLGWEYAMPVRF